jgi:hypothetical protein
LEVRAKLKLIARKRVALSELLATLIMLAVTLIAGAAVFGWINGQAASSEGAYGQSVANNVNFLNERFVVLTETFSGGGSGGSCSGGTAPNYQCTGSSFWIYNTGQVGFTLLSLRIRNLTDIPASAANPNPLNILFYTASTTACSATSQTCGFIAYNKAGTSKVCSSNAAWSATTLQPGFYQNGAVPTVLGVGQLSSNPYQITMPTAATCSAGAMYLYDGLAYTFTFTGLYGNTFSTTVTANG